MCGSTLTRLLYQYRMPWQDCTPLGKELVRLHGSRSIVRLQATRFQGIPNMGETMNVLIDLYGSSCWRRASTMFEEDHSKQLT